MKSNLLQRRCPGLRTMSASILSAVLAVLLFMPVLVSCAANNENQTAVTTAAGSLNSDEMTVVETTGSINDDLPDNLNYGNKTFTFLAWNQTTVEYSAEENTGDIVNDAIYSRNTTVEARLGVDLNYIMLDGNSASFSNFCTTAENSVLAGTGSYDAIACYSRSAGVLTMKGVLSNLLDTQYLNFEKPWWPSSLLNLNTINNSLYFMSGDIATSLIYQMTFLIVNNDLARDLGIENPQALVPEGKWTLDKMFELCEGVYSDLDGNSQKTINDRFGLVINNHPLIDLFFVGSGMTYITTAADGSLILSDKYFTDKTYDIISRMNKLLWTDKDGTYDRAFTNTIMAQGSSLFYVVLGATLATADFRSAGFEYNILPSPKYNESQESYYTAVGFPHSMYCIPIDAHDRDMSSAVMECLASESYRTVTPALFDTAFKYKYSNSQLDAEIFEIIRSTVVFETGRFFFDALGGDSSSPIRTLRLQLENNNNNLASQGAKYQKIWEKSLADIYAKISQLK